MLPPRFEYFCWVNSFKNAGLNINVNLSNYKNQTELHKIMAYAHIKIN